MTKAELMDQLADVLASFDDENTVVEVHITLTDITVGNTTPLHPQKDEKWWDENFAAWLPWKPE